MKFLFCLTAATFLSISLSAQQLPTPSPDGLDVDNTTEHAHLPNRKFVFQRYTWDASIDASFILPSFYTVNAYGFTAFPTSAPGSIGNYGGWNYGNGSLSTYAVVRSTRFLVRKNESVMNSANVAVRKGAYRIALNISGDHSNASDDSVSVIKYSGGVYFRKSFNYFTARGSLGYEWQQQFGRFQFIYGYDAFLGAGRQRDLGEIRSNTAPAEDAEYRSSYISLGVAPLVGVKFFVHSRFSLSLESAYNINYFRSRSRSVKTGSIVDRDLTENGFQYGLTPISAFTATFHFGSAMKP